MTEAEREKEERQWWNARDELLPICLSERERFRILSTVQSTAARVDRFVSTHSLKLKTGIMSKGYCIYLSPNITLNNFFQAKHLFLKAPLWQSFFLSSNVIFNFSQFYLSNWQYNKLKRKSVVFIFLYLGCCVQPWHSPVSVRTTTARTSAPAATPSRRRSRRKHLLTDILTLKSWVINTTGDPCLSPVPERTITAQASATVDHLNRRRIRRMHLVREAKKR